MSAAPRIHVISATLEFDGSTPFAGTWQPKVDPQQPRLNVSDETLGRFSFTDLVRAGVTSALLLARVLDGSSSMVMAQRSASAAEIGQLVVPDDPTPFVDDEVITSVSLSTSWSAPLLLGSTDALTFVGDRNTVELMIFEVGDSAAAAVLLQSVVEASSLSSVITVTTIPGSGIVPAFSGRTYFLFSSGGAATLPDSADVPAGAEAYFINVSGDVVILQTNGVDTLNGAAAGITQAAGFGGIYVAAVGGGRYLTDEPLLAQTQTLANAVAGATVNLPDLSSPSISVELDFTARGSLRLPALSGGAKSFRYLLYRTTVGTAQIALTPALGDTINGSSNPVYLPANGAFIVEPGSNSWAVTALDGVAPEQVEAGNVVLEPWGTDELLLRLNGAGAQTATLPSTLICAPRAKLLVFATGAAKTVAAAGGETITGNGIAAAPSFTVANNTCRSFVADSNGNWIAQ
jgi:hypothetical protein